MFLSETTSGRKALSCAVMLEVMTTRRCAIGVPHRGIQLILLEESKITDKPTTVPEIIHIIYETNCMYIYII